MDSFAAAFTAALELVLTLDPALAEIVLLSLRVSLSAVLIAGVIGLPLGAAVAPLRFPCRHVVTVLLNALMWLPSVVVGLVVYFFLSRPGPFVLSGLLFTSTSINLAQVVRVTPHA